MGRRCNTVSIPISLSLLTQLIQAVGFRWKWNQIGLDYLIRLSFNLLHSRKANPGKRKSVEMPEPEEPKSTEEEEEEEEGVEALIMDFDNLDDSWSWDQILLLSDNNIDNISHNPMSPLYVPCSDQLFSPPWAFADGNDDAAHATSAPPDSSLLLSCEFRIPSWIGLDYDFFFFLKKNFALFGWEML